MPGGSDFRRNIVCQHEMPVIHHEYFARDPGRHCPENHGGDKKTEIRATHGGQLVTGQDLRFLIVSRDHMDIAEAGSVIYQPVFSRMKGTSTSAIMCWWCQAAGWPGV